MDQPDITTGFSITFDSGFFAQILDVNHTGISRGIIDTSHMLTTTARTFKPSDLFDPGGLDIEIHFDADVRPPIDDTEETMTLTFPLGAAESTPTTWAFTAFMSDFAWAGPLEDKLTATCNIKASGDITITVAT